MRILKWSLVGVLGLFLALLLVTLLDRGVTFRLTCEDSATLAAGDPLVLEGTTIGRVVMVIPHGDAPDEAIVRVATRHRARAHRGLQFRLARQPEGEGLFVEIHEATGDPGEPILKGETLSAEPLDGWSRPEPRP